MALTTLAQVNAASRQRVRYFKTAGPTTTAGTYWGFFSRATDPPAGTLAVGNTTAGVVPTDATTGYPAINAFGAGNTGYLVSVETAITPASTAATNAFGIYDCLWSAGAFNFNANATITGNPSFSGRVPNSDYSGLEIWLEQVTTGTGAQSVAIGYTNQAGTAGRSTGTINTATNAIERMHRIPLQAGDSGVQSIQTVVGSVATAGTFNIHIMRPLFHAAQKLTPASIVASANDVYGPESTSLPIVYDTSAVRVVMLAGSGTSQLPMDIWLEIVDG